MSHHTSDLPLTQLIGIDRAEEKLKTMSDMLRMERETLKQTMLDETLGPTKDFPHGRLVPHDEGGLIFGVTVFNGRVIFDFGKPVRSIGFTREGALELAELIKQRAESCPVIFASRRAGEGR